MNAVRRELFRNLDILVLRINLVSLFFVLGIFYSQMARLLISGMLTLIVDLQDTSFVIFCFGAANRERINE